MVGKQLDANRTIELADTVAANAAATAANPAKRVGSYELIRELGRGGMGAVFLARDTKLGRRVAIKFLHSASKDLTARFLAEARVTAQVSHENIVVIHEVGEHDGTPHMVLEYLEGTPLRERMTNRPMPAARAVALMLPVVRAVARAHAAGVVHRDLKPENILVTTDGIVKVLDFGIAKALLGPQDASVETATLTALPPSAVTSASAIIGTPAYMAPEQFYGRADLRADLWAIGVMLFEMLAGKHPLAPCSTVSLIASAAQLEEPMPAVSSIVPDLPEALQRAVDRCLRKLPEERYSSADELLADLEAAAPVHGRARASDANPYPGLASFQETDADRFFGRSRDIARLVARLRDQPLVGVAGPSGLGKSSLIRAGVVPALKASGEAWDVVTIRPGRHPLASLASALVPPDQRDAFAARLRTEPGALGAWLRDRAARREARVLLFVDQFEEVYTLLADADERLAFTASVAGAADDPSSPVRVVVAVRSDFLDRAGEDRPFLDDLTRGLVFLPPLTRPDLCEAVTRPLDLVEYDFESDALVDRMLDDLASTTSSLPLLQFTAARLWDARDRKTKRLTVEAYEAMGGVAGALASHADDVLANMPPQSRALVRQLFRRLVTAERTRAVVEVRDVLPIGHDAAQTQSIIDQLVAARLLVVQNEGTPTVEIVHESLITGWPTLQRWLDEDRDDAVMLQQIAAAAKQWETKGRSPDLLWRGDVLDEARRWNAQRPHALAEREAAFLAGSLSAAARGRRMRRIAVAATMIVLAAVAAGALIAYVRVHAAEQRTSAALAALTSETQARRDADDARTAALAALLSEEQLRKAAEDGLLTEAQLKEIAEAKRRVAERQKLDADAARLTAEQRRARAEQELARAEGERLAAQKAAQQHAVDAQLTREQLAAKNAELEAALAAAKSAREKAETAVARADALRVDAERTKATLQKSLDTEKAHVERLERERKKITTDLR